MKNQKCQITYRKRSAYMSMNKRTADALAKKYNWQFNKTPRGGISYRALYEASGSPFSFEQWLHETGVTPL